MPATVYQPYAEWGRISPHEPYRSIYVKLEGTASMQSHYSKLYLLILATLIPRL